MEQNKVDKEKTKKLIQKLDTGVIEFLSSDKYKTYLKKMSQFHNYSYANTLLILTQNENATLVAGYRAWQDKFKRNVNKGEKGIQIIAPCPYKVKKEIEVVNQKGEKELSQQEVIIPYYKTVTVFDVSQTTGEPINILANELQGSVKDYDSLLNAIIKCTDYDIEFRDIELGAKGVCFKDKKIWIQQGMSEQQTIKTLLHEIAHSKIHFSINNEIIKNQKEVEAESVAYVVSNHFGIDTSSYSFEYIGSWQKNDVADIKNSFKTIQEVSNDLINTIKNNLEFNKNLSISEKIQIAENEVKKEQKKNKSTKRNKDISL